ncbi:MAG: hypothetical protein RMM58_05725 [Chloroflexota bacterium]|nr:hypothetical protein [Dehalococcoidia bacterium]MDW8253360.1 hypothetical protein [Chloroflexota bacterium]
MAEFLRIVSYNTAKGDGAYRRRLAGMARALDLLSPDLVLLQEALLTADGRFDTARDLGAALGATHVALAVRHKQRIVEGESVSSWSSPALLSRWPILEFRPFPLPSDPADGERVALGALVATPLGQVRLLNAHLTHLPLPNLRARQVAALLASPWLAEPADLRLLGGDLNAEADAPELTLLFNGSAGWEAVDALAAKGVAGGTLIDMATGERRAARRIDHLILLRAPEDPHITVIGAQLVLGDAQAGGALSDHLGVLADVAVARRSREEALI